ncbi:hypothetical protein ACLOJK_039478 [Asimina triloba]
MKFLLSQNLAMMYSELISKKLAGGGPFSSKTSYVKLLRSVKRETLKLIETFVDKAEDHPHVGKQFVPPMMYPVLWDYARNIADARESEVLSLFATIINKYKSVMTEDVPSIFEAVFECTLEMITKNFEDYPEHRLKFFSLLRAIATYCFQALIQLSSPVDSGSLTEPLWDAATVPYPYLNNSMFVREYTIKLLGTSLPNMTTAEVRVDFNPMSIVLFHLIKQSLISWLLQVTQFVNGLFEFRNDLSTFKNHIRDFLVQSKEFSAQDNKDLYAEEVAAQRERERQRMLSIPGLIAPSELQEEMADS